LKALGFFAIIYGWFMLYDAGFAIEPLCILIAGILVVSYEEILDHVKIIFKGRSNGK
jgi:hypothetical protein